MGQATSRMEMAEGTEHKVQVRGLDRDLDRDQSVETGQRSERGDCGVRHSQAAGDSI